MPGTDPTHWLNRLAGDEWLAAADNELRQGDEALARRAFRQAVTHARRAAGMAQNAVLVRADNPAWGRSYMDHVVALADDAVAPDGVRDAARILRETPAAAPELVSLGKPDTRILDAARRIVAWCRDRVAALAHPA